MQSKKYSESLKPETTTEAQVYDLHGAFVKGVKIGFPGIGFPFSGYDPVLELRLEKKRLFLVELKIVAQAQV